MSRGFADDVTCAPVALRYRRHESSGFFERHMRRERGYFWIGLHLQYDRPIVVISNPPLGFGSAWCATAAAAFR